VQRADDLAGPNDLIARVWAPGLDELGGLVAAPIKAVNGITRTLTCTVIHRQPSRPGRLVARLFKLAGR
jgi:hypothetical protein